MTRTHAAWTYWVAASVVAAAVCALVLGMAFWARLEALIVAFAAGMVWNALTPRILRAIDRLRR